VAVEPAEEPSQRPTVASVWVEISPAELLDKITILIIKAERLGDPTKLAHVRAEFQALMTVRERAIPVPWVDALKPLLDDLKAANEAIWDAEEVIRRHERAGDFGPGFIEAARTVPRENDRRARIKRIINERLGSRFQEEKSHDLGP
jgi:hypothetical protein